MFNTKFLNKRKYAVYKQDKTPWTQEEYNNVILIFEGPTSTIELLRMCAIDLGAALTYISDFPDGINARYHLWYNQQREQELKSFTKISYEELLKQSKIPLLKRRKDDSHKNETPTTSSK